ncbi:MAG: hypothetical protein FD180_1539 [Planctomycetota bacterium]|nr:MAG: hypothetical protein FD180_1539 [Planctomycetota bacterium]
MKHIRFNLGQNLRAARCGARMFPFGFVLAGVMGLLVLGAIAVAVIVVLTVA